MQHSCIPTLSMSSQTLRPRLCNKRALKLDVVPSVTIPENEVIPSEEVSDDILKEAYPDTEIVNEDHNKNDLAFKAAVLIGFVLYTYFMYHMVNSPDL